ncbi:hypothetical protein CCHR01_01417 [Colletotrichum chrysophilum]|uniref:Uncharacterized protein n=1 Tax=Colletotrichum chrysophilum TaxID=1836956 RepID=A0AAD9EPB8_9PEZI|nr:hypothetical protein CCHR01_01417 [Colletotrichum chrysophilum]
MVEHCLDLEQVDEHQDAELSMDNGVKRGAATRFIRDIREWALCRVGRVEQIRSSEAKAISLRPNEVFRSEGKLREF